MNKHTVVIGAAPESEKYSYKAVTDLKNNGHTVYAIGIKQGSINGVEIKTDRPAIENVDTVTLYIGPARQADWKDYILNLKPKRVIFNPGTENAVLEQELEANKIECIEACTLVMLSVGNY